jgi:hypothetical protein
MQPETSVRVIHVIFKTHLDVGFTDFAQNVVANYFEHFIPAALDLAEEMRRRGGPERFIWTTGSWLIYEYLKKAPAPQRERMETAIRRGDIVWHALPFTTHTELNDVELFRSGLSLCAELDQRFGRNTIAAKMTDVPGHTRGLVPLLAEAGVRFLHIGVNGASKPPKVPPVFRWQDPDGSEVVVMYHKGYGSLMLVPGLDEAIYFAHTSDNLGPQKPEAVVKTFQKLARQFPGAEVRASTLDAFAAALEKVRGQLPVLKAEIGDTWIHGGGTDPKKVANLRELLRLRSGWLAEGKIQRSDPRYKAFSQYLQLVTEHTWGLDEKTHLADYEAYAADKFQTARSLPNFRKFERSWAEQRQYVDQAVEALAGMELQREAQEALAAIQPQRPELEGWSRVDPYLPYGAGRFTFGFNDQGGMAYLLDRQKKQTWANPDHALGEFAYQTFSAADYERFYRQYNVNKRRTAAWSVDDFTKPGLAAAGAKSALWQPKLERMYTRADVSSERFLLWLSMPSEPVLQYGAPAELFLEVNIPLEEPKISFELQWFDKAACRMPEALWFSFQPRSAGKGQWSIEKLGEWVSPLDVVYDGNRHLHACGKGVRWQSAESGFEIISLDAALVAPGEKRLLEFTNRQPRLSGGMHFLLGDNLWGTNFPMWFGEDARFRFEFNLA